MKTLLVAGATVASLLGLSGCASRPTATAPGSLDPHKEIGSAWMRADELPPLGIPQTAQTNPPPGFTSAQDLRALQKGGSPSWGPTSCISPVDDDAAGYLGQQVLVFRPGRGGGALDSIAGQTAYFFSTNADATAAMGKFMTSLQDCAETMHRTFPNAHAADIRVVQTATDPDAAAWYERLTIDQAKPGQEPDLQVDTVHYYLALHASVLALVVYDAAYPPSTFSGDYDVSQDATVLHALVGHTCAYGAGC